MMAGRNALRFVHASFGLATAAIAVLAAATGRSSLAAEAWIHRTSESLTGEVAHVAAFALSPDRFVHFEVGCGPSSAPWIAIAVNDPDTMARGLADDSPIPVIFTFVQPSSVGLSLFDHRDRVATAGMPQAPPGGSFSVRITGTDVPDLASRIAGDYGYVEVRQGDTTTPFSLAGAAEAVRQVVENCPAWPR